MSGPRVWTCPEPVTALATAVQGSSVVVGGSEGGVWIMPQTSALRAPAARHAGGRCDALAPRGA